MAFSLRLWLGRFARSGYSRLISARRSGCARRGKLSVLGCQVAPPCPDSMHFFAEEMHRFQSDRSEEKGYDGELLAAGF